MRRGLDIGALFGVVAWVCAAAGPGIAHAQGRRVVASLDWRRGTGGDTCISTAELARLVEAVLERHVWTAQTPDARVRGDVARIGGEWLARISLLRADGTVIGTREVRASGTDCRALDTGLGLVVALMIDLPRDHSSLRIPVSRGPRARAGILLGPRALVGIVPGVGAALGVDLFVDFTLGVRWRVDLEAMDSLAQSATVGVGERVRVQAAAVGGSLGPALPLGSTFELLPRAGVTLAHVDASGEGFARDLASSAWVSLARAGCGIAWVPGRAWRIELALDLFAALNDVRFSFDSGGGALAQAHRVGPLGGTLGLSVGGALPLF